MHEIAEQEEKATQVAETERKVIQLAWIRAAEDGQPRVKLDQKAIADYVAGYEAEDAIPPIVVFYEYGSGLAGKPSGPTYWLGDGFHRLAAMLKLGTVKKLVELRRGSRRDALLYAIETNARHGVRFSNADKRRSVVLLLADEEWSKWSDREIAKRVGVSNKFVSNIRNEIRAAATVNGTQLPPEVTTGADGKERKRPALRVVNAEADEPEASTVATPLGKWRCVECNTWWPNEVKDCGECEANEETPETPKTLFRHTEGEGWTDDRGPVVDASSDGEDEDEDEDESPFDPVVAAGRIFSFACDRLAEWPADANLEPLMDVLSQLMKRVAKLQTPRAEFVSFVEVRKIDVLVRNLLEAWPSTESLADLSRALKTSVHAVEQAENARARA